MLHTGLPQLLRRLMGGQLETDRRFVLLEFTRSDLKVEVVTLVRNLQDLGPREPIDPQSIKEKTHELVIHHHIISISHSLVPVDQQSSGADTQHDINALRILRRMQINSVHGQLLGVLQVVQLCHGRGLALVRLMQVHDLLLQLGRLIRRELELLQVVAVLHLLRIVVSQLRLHQVRAQQCVCDERARQTTLQNVVAHLQAEMVPRNVLLQLRRFRWVELDCELQHPRIMLEHLRHLLVQVHPDPRIRRCRVQQAEVVLLDDVQAGADCIQQVAAFYLALEWNLGCN